MHPIILLVSGKVFSEREGGEGGGRWLTVAKLYLSAVT